MIAARTALKWSVGAAIIGIVAVTTPTTASEPISCVMVGSAPTMNALARCVADQQKQIADLESSASSAQSQRSLAIKEMQLVNDRLKYLEADVKTLETQVLSLRMEQAAEKARKK
jgi:hypothetical protein